ncbi:zinc finger protein ZXDC isoform X1 [Tachysurus fulvidraco]|uniref:zinc finger protein ZXDC isoform X1 n=1 Tax=Tachysurus fulvidraco TaxID=1234273 RepID=UPI001FED65B6|nr:zinc finger protein ZXDC isoform X1 [Tachysurus fulvidraco]
MEIQGLSNAQNTHYQHGVLPESGMSSSGTTTGTVPRQTSNDNSFGLQTDNNNNRPSSAPLRLLAQNGSAARLCVQQKRSESSSTLSEDVQVAHVELCNLNVMKEKEFGDLDLTPDFVRAELKYGEENEDVLQMALPLFDGEEDGYTAQCEQQHRDMCPSVSDRTPASSEDKNPKEFYVVFNKTHDVCEEDREKRADAQHDLLYPETQDGNLTIKTKPSSTRSVDSLTTESKLGNETGSETDGKQEAETRSMAKRPDVMSCSDLVSVAAGHENTDLLADNNSQALMADYVNLSGSGNGDGPETFSGTIMINNQSIIVTIENGVLTLAATPEGYTYKEDAVVSLKEHLGVKEHEDIVLLNYEGGTKSLGKMAEDEDEGGAVSDSEELTLTDDCSLSELGALDNCPSVKREQGTLFDSDSTPQKPRCSNEDDLQPSNLVSLAKKGVAVSFRCPQPGCACAFESRQKLKMHLVFHAEDQRPFKCTMEGCGWSFTTSYKLKRHLQSHDKVRPYECEYENCGRRFTTVYNLKAHARAHEQEDAFACELCGERFRSATRLANHQRTHFEPERPHKCEFPGCEKAFITFSALFSHNRTHFRETSQFTCTYPGCDKRYDKACRLKIHLRSHTGERPFVCDSESCGWTFTSMSKLLRHKRKHDDDRRFICPEEGCGKSFTRAEHLKGHSITHLGTKPFECPVEGCNAKFSARSSLYIHSKKHRQDGVSLRSRCPVAGCTKNFSSRSSLKSHMLKHHNLSPDVMSQLENTATLTPSCELTSAAQSATTPGSVGTELSSLDLSSLFSNVPSGASTVPTGPSPQSGPASFTMDLALASSGILTIDPASVGSALGGAKPVDPLILAASGDMGVHVLDAGGGGGVLQQAALQLEDVQTVNPEALGALTALALQSTSSAEQLQVLSSTSALSVDSPSSSLTPSLTPSLSSSLTSPLSSSLAPTLTSSLVPPLASSTVPELLSPQVKADMGGSEAAVGPLISGVEVLSQPENNKALSQFVFPNHNTSYSGQKETELPSAAPCAFIESSGSARTDYRAIQLAKRKKQKGPAVSPSSAGATQRKTKGVKGSSAAGTLASGSPRFGEGTASTTTAGLTIRDPVTGVQYVQIQLLQDDPATDGDLAFQLSSQSSSSHSQLTVDLPVNILQEPSAMAEEDNGSENSQFTGSTINLQDLE